MSLGRRFRVWCDARSAPDCHEWIGYRATSVEVRKLARASGWKREPGYGRAGRDACPACASARDAG